MDAIFLFGLGESIDRLFGALTQECYICAETKPTGAFPWDMMWSHCTTSCDACIRTYLDVAIDTHDIERVPCLDCDGILPLEFMECYGSDMACEE